MRVFILTCILGAILLASATQARAQSGAVDVARRFYAAYERNEAGHGRLDRFIDAQKASFEPGLYAMLSRLARNQPGQNRAWLDFDPFINAQMNAASLRLGSPASRDGLASIPVYVSYRVKGHEQLATTVQLKRKGHAWIIVNFQYPARDGEAAWDLRSWLEKQLQRR